MSGMNRGWPLESGRRAAGRLTVAVDTAVPGVKRAP